MRFERYGPAELPQVHDLLSEVYAEVYTDRLGDPFFDVATFERRLASQASLAGWECVVGWDDGEAAGYAYGATLPRGSRWWRTTEPPPPADDAAEDGMRTVAVFEVMVRERWRGLGLAERVHAELLTGRAEERATLLVEVEHPRVLALYESWGYRTVGEQRPFPEAPVYAVMVRSLR